jgi:methylmalonyl-CoA mutase
MTEPNKTQDGPLLGDFSKPSYEQWRELAEEQLGGAPFEKKLVTQTPEGIDLQPIYTREDARDLPHREEIPGFGSFVRGVTAGGYVTQPWFIAQELPLSTPAELNSALLNDLDRGQSGLNILLDIATVNGKDPDQANNYEVGACGVSLTMLQDFERALKGVHLEMVPLFIQSGVGAAPVAAMIYALLRERGQSAAVLQGGLDMDPLGVLARCGTLPVSLKGAYREMALLIKHQSVNAPGLRAVGVSGLPYADGGASATEELAAVLGTAAEYLRRLMDAGIPVDTAARGFRFTFSAGADFFMTIAKLRAARMLWAQVARAFGAGDEAARMIMHVRTGLWDKTKFDPYVNMLRCTTEAFSGVVGGADSMHSGAFDEILRVPDRFSRRIARNTQIILQEECDLTHVIDPAGGSYFVEKLTREVAEASWKLFQEIESKGGMLSALESGWVQEKVNNTRKARQKKLAQRRDARVGTNMYANVAEKKLEKNIPDYEDLKAQRSRDIAEYRVAGDSTSDGMVMTKLQEIVDGDEERTFALMIDAAAAGASIGELTRALRTNDNDGELPKIEPVPFERAAEPYEKLRFAVEANAHGGERVKVFLLNIGKLVNHKIRADWSRAFFEPAGVDVIYPEGFDDMASGAEAAEQSGADMVVICGSDKDYPELVPQALKEIRERTPEMLVILAGYPGEHEQAYKDAGLDDYIFVKTNNYEFLREKLNRLNVL